MTDESRRVGGGELAPLAPTEEQVNEAIEIVAQHAIAAAVSSGTVDWEDYPELGEHDWERVLTRMEMNADYPDPDEFDAAYKLLFDHAYGGRS